MARRIAPPPLKTIPTEDRGFFTHPWEAWFSDLNRFVNNITLEEITDYPETTDDRYSLLGHTHTASEITDFTSAVIAIGDARYSLLGHVHTASEITDFEDAVILIGDARYSLLGHRHSAIYDSTLTDLKFYSSGSILYALDNIALSDNYINNDGGDDGLSFDNDAVATFSNTVTFGNSAYVYNQGETRYYDVGSSNYVGFKGSAAISSNLIWTLPSSDGYNYESLRTNGSGTMFWNLTNEPATGWPESPGVTVSFDDASRTLTVTDGGSAYYYINGIRYVLNGNKTVTLDNTEGIWFVKFSTSGLVASQTPWSIIDNNCAFVAVVFWDATNAKEIFVGYELHNYIMDASTHDRLHSGGGAAYVSGLGVSETGTEELNIAAGRFDDEDLQISITDGVGSSIFEQVLSPAELPIYYRSGTTFRKVEIAGKTRATNVGYILSTALQYNLLSGSWGLAAVPTAKFMAMWILATNEQDEPVIALMGQRYDNTLAEARIFSIYENLVLDGFISQELIVLARVIIKQSNSGAYYTIEEITDLRGSRGGGGVATPITGDHGALAGLGDDDHSQYLLLAGRSGGQSGYGGIDASDGLNLYSTSNATKGVINLGDTAYIDEVNNRVGIGTIPASTIKLHVASTSENMFYLNRTDTGTDFTIKQTSGLTNLVAGSGEEIAFTIGSAEAVRIDSSGNLGIVTDGVVLSFGADSEISLTHVHDTGLLLNSTNQLQFRDSALYINSAGDGYLDFTADAGFRFNTGLVGIGKTPTVSLDVESAAVPANFTSTSVGTTATFGAVQIRREALLNNNGVGISLAMGDSGGVTVNQEYGYIGALIIDNTATSEDGALTFRVTSAGSSRIEAMRITAPGTVNLSSVVNEGTTASKFLTLDSSGDIDFRTAAEVLSDIGAGTGSGTVGGTGTQNYVPKWSVGGTDIENSSISDNGTTVSVGSILECTSGLHNTFGWGVVYTGLGNDVLWWNLNNATTTAFISNAGSGIGLRVLSNSGNIVSFENSSEAVKFSVANSGTVNMATVANEGTTSTKILTLDSSNNVDYRTPSEIFSDIGAGTVGGTGTATYLSKWSLGGADIEDSIVSDDGSTVTIGGTANISTVANEGTTASKILTLDASNNVDFRTAAELLTDIGASASSHLHDGQTLQNDGINSDGGTFSFTTTGSVIYTEAIRTLKTIAIGASIDTSILVAASGDITGITSPVQGLSVYPTWIPSGNNTKGFFGVNGVATLEGTSNIGKMSALNFQAYINGGSGTMSTYTGIYVWMRQVNTTRSITGDMTGILVEYSGGVNCAVGGNSYQMFLENYASQYTTSGTEYGIRQEGNALLNDFDGTIAISNDDRYLYLGSSSDCGITYGGVNMEFYANLVGSGYFDFVDSGVRVNTGLADSDTIIYGTSGNLVYFDASTGNVGFGTAPSSLITVHIASTLENMFYLNRTDTGTDFTIKQTSGLTNFVAGSGEELSFSIGATEAARFDASGNFGVGLAPTANMAGLSIEAGLLTLKETTTPTADSGYGKIYFTSANHLFYQDGDGDNHKVADEGDFTDWSASFSPTGYSSTSATYCYYKTEGDTVHVYFYIAGVSNLGTTTFTLPFASVTTGLAVGIFVGAIRSVASPSGTGYYNITSGSSTVSLYPDDGFSAFATTGPKNLSGHITYQKA